MMKNSTKMLTVGAMAFAIGLTVSNYAMSDTTNMKIGVVDLPQIVANSGQVKKLKSEQDKKINDMKNIVDKAREDIMKESDPAKRDALQAKYNNELNAKKNAIENEYSNKLKEIDQNIKRVVADKAKSENYDIVLSKTSVLYGGEDITDKVASSVK